MISAIELDREEVEAIMSHLPQSLREKLQTIIHESICDKGINTMKHFIAQYEDDDPMDHIVSFTCATIIGRIYEAAKQLMIVNKKEGKKGINGHDMGRIVSQQLKEEAKRIEAALREHEHDCSKH